ncbi:MAG: chitobiase/beta-hexosaminidase C-terminal domain-containing protein [Prevotella sp.]|nr:chitobiase/beta-hexosaminidase C-terminal domain-containing protein [Prevotella sp.]
MMTTSNSGGYIKVRTGENSNTWTFNVNDGYKITGIKIVGYSNNSNTNATITMTSMTIDGGSNILTSSDATVFPTGSSNAITLEKTDLEAESAIVCTFDNSNITANSGEKNKQIMVKITITYVQTKVVTVAPTITLTGNSVTLASTTEGATIYYTIDGSTPTTSSTTYESPFEITNSCTVRALAQKEDVASSVVMRDCYVTHSDALAVLGYNGGTLDSDSKIWTSTDGQYILTDGSWTESNKRTIGYANLAGSQDGFKLNHTDYYTLKVGDDIKVTKIVVIGKSWLTGSEGNASTIAFDGFTPSSISFYDYLTDGETYVKTAEFTPESELDYGATITMRPGNNQLGAYIEVYGVKRSAPSAPVDAGSVVTWDFSNLSALSMENGKSYSFKATDGTTEMRYSAGSSDAVVAKSGNTSGYLKENGKTGSGTVTDIDGSTNIKKNRLIRLYVTGKGKLTINCASGTVGGYTVYDSNTTNTAALSSTALLSSYTANTTSDEITVTNGLWIETTTKGYITSIVWTPSATGTILTTTANMAGWRAFYDADNSYTVDENTTVYIATAKDESSVTLTSIADIPSATPVILKTSANDFTMTLTKADATSSTTGNLLLASTSGQNLSGGNIYRLGYGDDGIGFYPWSTTSATAGIVYINTGDGARSLKMVFADESTGIGATLNDAIINSNVYDLQGRRVAQPQRGLYIMNGRKVVVK